MRADAAELGDVASGCGLWIIRKGCCVVRSMFLGMVGTGEVHGSVSCLSGAECKGCLICCL